MADKQETTMWWDKAGIALSGLCAVHCLFFPIAVALLPLWPVTEALHHWTHPVLFALILPTVYFAVRKKGTPRGIGIYLTVGLLLIGAAWVLHDWAGSAGEAGITLAGSLMLIRGHWLNYRCHRSRAHTHHPHRST